MKNFEVSILSDIPITGQKIFGNKSKSSREFQKIFEKKLTLNHTFLIYILIEKIYNNNIQRKTIPIPEKSLVLGILILGIFRGV